jgi:(2Fe-2S) ferredoxin
MQLSFPNFSNCLNLYFFTKSVNTYIRKEISKRFCLHIQNNVWGAYKRQFYACMYVCMNECTFVCAHGGRSYSQVSDCVNSQTVSMHHSTTQVHTFKFYRGYIKQFWCIFVVFRCLHSQRTRTMGKTLRWILSGHYTSLSVFCRFVSLPTVQDYYISFTFPSYLLLKLSYYK